MRCYKGVLTSSAKEVWLMIIPEGGFFSHSTYTLYAFLSLRMFFLGKEHSTAQDSLHWNQNKPLIDPRKSSLNSSFQIPSSIFLPCFSSRNLIEISKDSLQSFSVKMKLFNSESFFWLVCSNALPVCLSVYVYYRHI